MDRLLFRIDEAAEVLSLGKSKLYELLARGELPTVKIGRATRVPAESLQRWVRKQVAAAESAAAGRCRDEPAGRLHCRDEPAGRLHCRACDRAAVRVLDDERFICFACGFEWSSRV